MEEIFGDLKQIVIQLRKFPKPIEEPESFLKITGYAHIENLHSNILSYYLNPYKKHGLGMLFWHSLMDSLNFNINKSSSIIEISREVRTKKNNRIDIVIIANDFILGIENKINHDLNNDLEDYLSQLQELSKEKYNISEENVKLMVLAPKEIKLPNKKFLMLTYSKWFTNIINRLPNHYLNANAIHLIYLKEYISIMSETTPNKELFEYFYQQKDIINDFMETFYELQEEMTDKVIQLNDLMKDYVGHKMKLFIYENSWFVMQGKFSDVTFTVDTLVTPTGFRIMLFFREDVDLDRLYDFVEVRNILENPKSRKLIFKNQRILYKEFRYNEPLSTIKSELDMILNKIERYQD